MGKGYFVDSSDKLLDEKDHSTDSWNFQCRYCSGKNLSVHPIGLPFRYSKLDVTGLSIEAVRHYKSLPNVTEAIMFCLDNKGEGLLVECHSCRRTTKGFFNGNESAFPAKNRLKKYVSDIYGISDEFEL